MTNSSRRPRVDGSARSKVTFGFACWKRRATRWPSPRLAWKSSGARRQCSTRPTSRGTVFVEYQVDRARGTRGPYLIIDVCPAKRGGFHYEAAELTKKGTMHARRAPRWLFPNTSTIVGLSNLPVCEEGEREANYFRDCAKTSRVLAFEKGDLTLFQAVEVPLGSRIFRRKDRMSI